LKKDFGNGLTNSLDLVGPADLHKDANLCNSGLSSSSGKLGQDEGQEVSKSSLGTCLKTSLEIVGTDFLDKDANLCSAAGSAADKGENLCSAVPLSGGMKRERSATSTVQNENVFEDDRTPTFRHGVSGNAREHPWHIEQRIILEHLSYEAAGGDTNELFDTCALQDLGCGDLRPTEIASSSTAAPMYAIPNVEPPRKYAKINFDCADEIGYDESEGEADPNDEPDNLEDDLYHLSLPTRRRLRVKTSPLLTGYPKTALVTKMVYKVAMAQRRSQKASHNTEKAAAVKSALKLLAAQPELARDFRSESDSADCIGGLSMLRNPHPSHDIQTLPSHKEVIYCRRCSSWSMNIKLKALARPCEGLKTGNKGQLRLLQLGIVPLPGVRVPGHLRRIYARGRRRK